MLNEFSFDSSFHFPPDPCPQGKVLMAVTNCSPIILLTGFMPVDQLIALLARVINENEPALVAARAER